MKSIDNIFCEVFNVEASALGTCFNNETVACWDSVRQLALVAGIEKAFDILIDPEDIMECTSYIGVKQIIRKYGIEI
ncbi:MAG: acyl carrier protein [Bacteroidaceae bacterium]|nr:acyl carrier protein [Bacteroidaceae bacterium]